MVDYEKFKLTIHLRCENCGKLNKDTWESDPFIDGGHIEFPCEKCGEQVLYE